MNKAKVWVILIITAAVLGGAVFLAVRFLAPKNAVLSIESDPSAAVYIGGVRVGKTPYEISRKPGELTIKLIPESSDKPLMPYQTRVTLNPGIKTVVRRDFGDTDETSSGEVVSFEKISRDETSLAVISVPDSAQIAIDGQVRGFSPYKTGNLLPGEHQLTISAQGYGEKSLMLSAKQGYKLTATIKLAALPVPQVEAAQIENTKPVEEKKVFIEILTTPTGFLRVRASPAITSAEVGQVTPGQKYPFLEEDTASGWFKIKYQDEKEGWVTNEFAKKVEETAPVN